MCGAAELDVFVIWERRQEQSASFTGETGTAQPKAFGLNSGPLCTRTVFI